MTREEESQDRGGAWGQTWLHLHLWPLADLTSWAAAPSDLLSWNQLGAASPPILLLLPPSSLLHSLT